MPQCHELLTIFSTGRTQKHFFETATFSFQGAQIKNIYFFYFGKALLANENIFFDKCS